MRIPGHLARFFYRFTKIDEKTRLDSISASTKLAIFHNTPKYLATRKKNASLVLPLFAAAGLIGLSLLFSKFLLERDQDHVRAMTAAALTHVQSQITSELEGRLQAMERISEHWALGGMPTKNSWDEEARLYIRHYPGIQAVTWTAPSFQTRWAAPFEHNQYLLTSTPNSELTQALKISRERKRAFIADTIRLPRGGKGFAVYAPITVSRSGEFHGFTGGLFRGEKLFEIILANIATDYAITILDHAGENIFIRDRDFNSVPAPGIMEAPLELRGIRWKIRIWPSQALLKASVSALPLFVLAGGFLLSVLMGGIIYLLQQTRLRAFRIARTNLALKRQMKRRRKAETALRETSERLRLALQSSGMGVWRLDLVRDQMQWDDALARLLGLATETSCGSYEDFLKYLHPDDSDKTRTAIEQAIAKSTDYHSRFRIRMAPNASNRYLESRGSVHSDESGRPIYLSGVTWDVTEQNKKEEMERYAEVLKRSNDELERFAYVASHDLKSPLNNIVHYTEQLLNAYSLKTELADTPKIIGRMHKAAGRMSALIDGLLEYSRVETENKKMELIDLNILFEEILADLENHIAQHRGRVEIENLPQVTGDRLLIRQLFQNLLANAIKFHAPGTSPQVIVRAVKLQPSFTEIHIQDNGIGIEKEYLETIFKPFNRLHSRDKYEGSGIGLATCNRIIQRHGGTLSVESEPGQGSLFKIRLPKKNSPLLAHENAA